MIVFITFCLSQIQADGCSTPITLRGAVKITDQQDQVNPIDDSLEKDKDKHQVLISSSQDQDKTEYLELLQNIEIERDKTKI